MGSLQKEQTPLVCPEGAAEFSGSPGRLTAGGAQLQPRDPRQQPEEPGGSPGPAGHTSTPILQVFLKFPLFNHKEVQKPCSNRLTITREVKASLEKSKKPNWN